MFKIAGLYSKINARKYFFTRFHAHMKSTYFPELKYLLLFTPKFYYYQPDLKTFVSISKQTKLYVGFDN